MLDLPVPSTTDVLPASLNEQAVELLWRKLASAEAEAGELRELLADGDSLMTHADVPSSNDGTSQSGNTDGKVKTLSPVLANVTQTVSSHNALISRVCHMESAVSSFRATVARISRERDYWRRDKLSSDERCTRETDAFRMEIARLRKESERKCHSANEAKERLDKANEQLRNDLLQSVNSLVSTSQK